MKCQPSGSKFSPPKSIGHSAYTVSAGRLGRHACLRAAGVSCLSWAEHLTLKVPVNGSGVMDARDLVLHPHDKLYMRYPVNFAVIVFYSNLLLNSVPHNRPPLPHLIHSVYKTLAIAITYVRHWWFHHGQTEPHPLSPRHYSTGV